MGDREAVKKKCTKCGIEKEAGEFGQNRNRPDGLYLWCKDCLRQHYIQNRDRILEDKRRHYKENKNEKLKYQKQYSKLHKKERQEYNKKYNTKNHDEKLKKARQYYIENRDSRLKYRKQYYSDNYTKIRKEQKQYSQDNYEKKQKYQKEYIKTQRGREVHNVNGAKRYAIKKSSKINDLTANQWANIKALYQNHCLCCGVKKDSLTMDHIIPLTKGGNHTQKNIQPLCKRCNSVKGTKTIDYRICCHISKNKTPTQGNPE